MTEPTVPPRKPRRLFSFDTVKSASSRRTKSSETSKIDSSLGHSSSLSAVQESQPDDFQGPNQPLQTGRDNATNLNQYNSPWDTVREHVLQQPQPRRSASPRSGSPLPRKLARLGGFRQVVEQAQSASARSTQRFAADIMDAVYLESMPDQAKSKLETHGPSGSTLYLTFKSGNSVANTTIRHDRSPSLSTSQQGVSVGPLLQVLSLHASPEDPSRVAPQVPRENLVLYKLLGAFLTTETGSRIDSERTMALDAFELMLKTWPPVDESAGIDRCVWCCQAIIAPTPFRMRAVSALRFALEDLSYRATVPTSVLTLTQSLFSCLSAVAGTQANRHIEELVQAVVEGRYGDKLDITAVEEEYSALFLNDEDDSTVRVAIVSEGLAKCLFMSVPATARWLYRRYAEQFWRTYPAPTTYTPLLTVIYSRVLGALAGSLLPLHVTEASLVMHVLRTRVIPEIDRLPVGSNLNIPGSEARENTIRVVIELHGRRSTTEWASSLISQWYINAVQTWKPSVDHVLERFVQNSDWIELCNKVEMFLQALEEKTRNAVIATVFPFLVDRLVNDPPVGPSPALTRVLRAVARLFPQLFFKPLFLCAASSKDMVVVNHICALDAISKFMSDFWTYDAGMMSIALMSDPGSKLSSEGGDKPWGALRLGQACLLIEMIARVQKLRRDQGSLNAETYSEVSKFLIALESRLGILLEAKTKTVKVPPVQRLLLAVLFREIRLFTRTAKIPVWLSHCVSWFAEYYRSPEVMILTDSQVPETISQISQLQNLIKQGGRTNNQRRSTMVLSPTSDSRSPTQNNVTEEVGVPKDHLMASLAKGFVPKILKLLVSVAVLLSANEFRIIAPIVWNNNLDLTDPTVVASACFMLMQCADKAFADIKAILEADLQSLDARTRLLAARRISVLINWRFQIASQQIITDRTHRAFKLGRVPLPFIATDVGSGQYVAEDDPDDSKDKIPREMRKRLADIGWADEDSNVDRRLEIKRIPMSLLPAHQFDTLDSPKTITPAVSPAVSPTSSPKCPAASRENSRPDDIALLRRNSSTGGPATGVKRRAVFVPSLASVLPQYAALVYDLDVSVASATRHALMDIMRNDSSLLLRPLMDYFTGAQKDTSFATTVLHAFIHIRRVLPPPTVYHIFNDVAGFLKYSARLEVGNDDVLADFAYMTPILAKLVAQVSDLNTREFRRAKLEQFFVPSGALWFSAAAPSSPMFPRAPFSRIPDYVVPKALVVRVTMVRVSQNMLFHSMLKRNPQDVQIVRKGMTRLTLPVNTRDGLLNESVHLDPSDFLPGHSRSADASSTDAVISTLSLMLSRSYLLLAVQVFRSLPRHLNDRAELAVIIDGINRILLHHGDDISIVGSSLIALMTASTRFKRLFTSGNGYALFMPALLKVYAEHESHEGIRYAIAYAVDRFFALHGEGFVFQSLDSLSTVISAPGADRDWIAKSVFALFSTLRKEYEAVMVDTAGIVGVNKQQEREALLVITAEEKTQTFIASMRQGAINNVNLDALDALHLPEEYETRHLAIDDFVRLLLTVVAHDTSISRAERFLRMLAYMAPFLYKTSVVVQNVLQDGVEALGAVISKTSAKAKHTEAPGRAATLADNSFKDDETLPGNDPSDVASEKVKSTSDMSLMRLDYLTLVLAIAKSHGHVRPQTLRYAVDIINIMLKDPSSQDDIASFFGEFSNYVFARKEHVDAKEAMGTLEILVPVITSQAISMDLSPFYSSVSRMLMNPACVDDLSFRRLVVGQVCASGLAACEQASSQGNLAAFPSRHTFIPLVAQSFFLLGVDMMAEVEKCTPIYNMLARVILPLVMSFKGELASDDMNNKWKRIAFESAWVRLFYYAFSALDSLEGSVPSSKPEGKRPSTSSLKTPRIPTFIITLQIIKTLIVRAQSVLSSCIPDIWTRLRARLVLLLEEGGTSFAFGGDHSASPSPTPSPRASGQFDYDPFASSAVETSTTAFSSPRAVDYATWSFFQFLCAFRNPLRIQMQVFLQEKLVELRQKLVMQQRSGILHPSPRARRLSSPSAFSKPRLRLSGLPSPDASPNLSPSLSASASPLLSGSPVNPFLVNRQPAFRGSPRTPAQGRPRIVHLGPAADVSARLFSHRTSNSVDSNKTVPGSTKIRSPNLIRATYERIRMVQLTMGYDELLPIPGDTDSDREIHLQTWTRNDALQAILQETESLMDELDMIIANR